MPLGCGEPPTWAHLRGLASDGPGLRQRVTSALSRATTLTLCSHENTSRYNICVSKIQYFAKHRYDSGQLNFINSRVSHLPSLSKFAMSKHLGINNKNMRQNISIDPD